MIESECIGDLLQPVYEKDQGVRNVLLAESVAVEIKGFMPALKRVVQKVLEWDSHM